MKTITPMFMLKSELALFKGLPFISYFELNRKEGKTKHTFHETYKSSPVTFDFMSIFNINGGVHRNEKGHVRYDRSFSFCFNFKNGETTVRASFKPSKESSAEYSPEFTVADIKVKMTSLMESPHSDVESFLKAFVSTFDIVLSSTLTPSDVKTITKTWVDMVEKLTTEIKFLDQTKERLRNNMYDIEKRQSNSSLLETYRQNLTDAMDKTRELWTKKHHILTDGAKDIPAYPRKLFYMELEQKRIIY